MDKLFKFIVGLLFALCLFSSMNTAQASSKDKLVKTGNAQFASGNFDEAIRAYDEAAVEDPESPVIYFNKGAALYKKENYAAARDAFGQAAIKTKDISLEAKSKFNLGVCFFREGERQKDSDLKKTLQSYGSSVQSFQEALALDPKFTEAAENIELVRLMMKSVLDEIKKQEEDARKQQEEMRQTAETIKKLIKRQKDLLNENQSLLNNKQTQGREDTAAEQKKNIADVQEQLKNDTQNLSDQLARQGLPSASGSSSAPANTGKPPTPEHPSKEHLDASVMDQENAIARLSEAEADSQTAAENQQKSLDNLNKALEALDNGQANPQMGQQQQKEEQRGDQKQQEGNDPQQKNQKEQNQESASSGEEAHEPEDQPPDQNQPQPQVVQLPDDAENILNEEKENQKQRIPFSSGGFQKVDKDW